MVGFWFIFMIRELYCFPLTDFWKKLCYQISGSLLSIFILLEVAVFCVNYFILKAIESEMQSLSTGRNESINTILTTGS